MSSIELCPKCGSGKVEVTDRLAMVSGGLGAATCPCGWSGPASQLVVKQLQFGEAEAIAVAVSTEYMRALAAYAASHVGRAMVVVGLVPAEDKRTLARLIKAAVLAAHKATLEEVEKIQQEIKDGIG